jgi:hypothetical protein
MAALMYSGIDSPDCKLDQKLQERQQFRAAQLSQNSSPWQRQITMAGLLIATSFCGPKRQWDSGDSSHSSSRCGFRQEQLQVVSKCARKSDFCTYYRKFTMIARSLEPSIFVGRHRVSENDQRQ